MKIKKWTERRVRALRASLDPPMILKYNAKLLKFSFRYTNNLPFGIKHLRMAFQRCCLHVHGLCNVFWTTLENYWNLNFVWLGLCWGHECRQLLQMSFPEFNLILGIAHLIRSKCLKQSNFLCTIVWILTSGVSVYCAEQSFHKNVL